jgi:hypothetical protein
LCLHLLPSGYFNLATRQIFKNYKTATAAFSLRVKMMSVLRMTNITWPPTPLSLYSPLYSLLSPSLLSSSGLWLQFMHYPGSMHTTCCLPGVALRTACFAPIGSICQMVAMMAAATLDWWVLSVLVPVQSMNAALSCFGISVLLLYFNT